MEIRLPSCFFLAALALPVAAYTQQEMLEQYGRSVQPIPCRYHSCYRDGMLMLVDYVPRVSGEHPLALALTPRGCRLDDGLPDDTPVRSEDEFRIRMRCVAADGSRMGFLQLMVGADGCPLRVERSSNPGDYVQQRPFVFRHGESASTLTWKFKGGAFLGLAIVYSVGTQAGIEYGANGEVKTVSFIPSRAQVVLPPTPPEVVFEVVFEPSPIIDLSEVERALAPESP